MTNYIKYFLEVLIAEKNISENTVLAYKKDIQDLFDYSIFNKIILQKITIVVIKNFITQLNFKNLGSKTINRKISTIKQFFFFFSIKCNSYI